MRSSLISPRIDRRGFTLVELMVSLSLMGAAFMILLSVLTSTMTLSTQNTATNMSGYRARQTLDRLNTIVRFATAIPTLINSDGSTASGTTADGMLIKNSLGAPYVFKNSSGNASDSIPSGANSFMVEYASSAGLDTPKVGDYFLLNLSTQPELEVASVTPASSVGSISRAVITTKTGITETATPNSYTVSASRYRKEAYIFVQSGSYWTLRHYPKVTAAMSYSTASSYVELGTGFQKMGAQAWFTTTTDNGAQASWLHAVARSSNHGEYTESVAGHTTLTTMPVQIKLWNYNAPPATQ